MGCAQLSEGVFHVDDALDLCCRSSALVNCKVLNVLTIMSRREAATIPQRSSQEGEGLPAQRRSGAGGCIPRRTHPAGMLRQNPGTAVACDEGDAGQG